MKNIKPNVGVWIDHREAIIVVLTETGEVTKHIRSNVEKQPRRSGEPDHGSFETQEVPAEDSHEREYTGHLARYYDGIILHLRDAGRIVIFGPGEAKGELRKRFEKAPDDARTIELETVDKMTEPEFVALVRHHFNRDLARYH
jgi:hypothetical protein